MTSGINRMSGLHAISTIRGSSGIGRSCYALLLVFVLAQAPQARANGRFPAAGQLVVDPSVPYHIVVRTTYGLLTTRDAGTNWDWICETGAGYSATTPIDPAMGVTADGTVLAAFAGGLSVAPGDTCHWTFAEGGLKDQNVVDVSIERADPTHAVAIVSNALGGGAFQTQLYSSSDNAVTWAQAGIDLPADFEAETLDVAPLSSPPSVVPVTARVYVSGLKGGATGVLVRTDDGGASWETFEITWLEQDGTTGTSDVEHVPFIAGVDPVNPDVVYVRLSGTPGRLLVTQDGGTSWTLAFKGKGSLKGFALSPDGSQLLVGGDADGTWRGPTSTFVFEPVSTVRPQCLTWVDAGVYACALEYNDGFTVGYSSDDGATWQALNTLSCVRGPLSCPEGTSVQSTCEDAWAATAELIDQPSCDTGETTPTPTPQASPTTAPPSGDQGSDDDSGTGCACSSSSLPTSGSGVGLLLLGVLKAMSRRLKRWH